MDNMKKDEPQDEKPDELAESLDDLFCSISTMIKSELQGTNNHLELLEKMNVRVAEEYKGFGDLASGLRVFVEQLKCKSGSFNEYVEQIDNIEKQVSRMEDSKISSGRQMSTGECTSVGRGVDKNDFSEEPCSLSSACTFSFQTLTFHFSFFSLETSLLSTVTHLSLLRSSFKNRRSVPSVVSFILNRTAPDLETVGRVK